MHLYRPDRPAWVWLRLTGPDSQDFLHRILTAHVRALKPGEGVPACLLTGQGKVEAWFTLWNTGPSEYAFELDGGENGEWKQRLLAAIDRLTFSEKIQLEEVAGLKCVWAFFEDAAEQPAGSTRLLPDGVRVCGQGSLQYGRPWVTYWGQPEQLEALEASFRTPRGARPDELTFETLEDWRILALRPRVGLEVTENTIPLEAGLVETIGRAKGCYPGQEVIERIIALGAPARKLVQFEILPAEGQAPASGDPLVDPTGIEVGVLTSVSHRHAPPVGLGFVRKTLAVEGRTLGIRGRPGVSLKVVRVSPHA